VLVNLRSIVYGMLPEPHVPEGEPVAGDASQAVVDEHEVYFQGEWLPTRVYDRAKLRPGHRVEGPAIVTEFDSTTVVLSGYAAEVDRYLNLIINPTEE
jgi:N-methylhydantoinase A